MFKSTVADQSTLHLAPIVIDEIRVQGSRCGPFEPALRALSQHSIDVRPLISARFSLDEGLTAFQYAAQKGVLKVLVRVPADPLSPFIGAFASFNEDHDWIERHDEHFTGSREDEER